MIQIHKENRNTDSKISSTFNPDIFHILLIGCYETNSIQHESNYIYYIQTNWCKPLAMLITSSFIVSEDSSWLFLSFHILCAYYLIFFWRPWLFPVWKWTIIAALQLTKSVEQRNKRVVFSMVNQQRSTLIIILHYSFLFCALEMVVKELKMSFMLTIMHEICMVTLKHNMNNKDKIEFTKRSVLWSHTVCLKESCLRLFDVNQCMKDRSNWPEVTLKFALFNHVFHVRCIKKKNYNLTIIPWEAFSV